MKKLVPLLDRIIAKKIESTLKKQSAIIMTTTQTKSNEAVVVEVGPGVEKSDGTRKPMQCKKDDIIIFDARFGFEIELEDEKYVILKDTDVMAIVKDIKPKGTVVSDELTNGC